MAHRFSAPLFFPLIAAIVLGAALGDAGAQSPSQLDTPLDAPGGPPGLIAVQPMWNPAPLLVQGKAYLVYELLLTNFQTAPITLDSLRADGGPMGVFKFDDGDLKSMLDVPARYGPPGQELNVNPLQTRMLLLWLPFESTRVPHRILHKINYSVASGTGAQVQRTAMSVVADPMPVDYRATPVSIGPPLRGGNWLAANGPSNTS